MKKRNLSRKKYKKILNRLITVTMLLIVVMNFVSPMMNNNSFAAVTPEYEGSAAGRFDGMGSQILDVVMYSTIGSVGSALSAVVLLVVGIIYMLIVLVFSPILGVGWLPGPEDIVFNHMEVLDPNFVNPAPGAYIASAAKDSILKFYQTGYVVAGSIFVIGAMIIGIKLAVTSIASEKAYYKEMIGTWIKGLVLLFTVHILITACFYINEQIVAALDKSLGENGANSLQFDMSFQLPNPVGKIVTSIVNLVTTGEASSTIPFKATGIQGLIGALILRAMIGNDLISAIVVAALLGQLCSLLVTYFKRVFVCIALAAIAPYVVAVDFIRKLV